AAFGEKGDTKANANKGNVVIIPTAALLTPKLSRIAGTKAPTDVSGARKVEANNKIPSTNKNTPCLVRFLLSASLNISSSMNNQTSFRAIMIYPSILTLLFEKYK